MQELVSKLPADADVDVTVGENLQFSVFDDADVYVTHPERPPLSSGEPHAELKISLYREDGGYVRVTLDGEALDGLADAIHQIQAFHQEERT